MEEIKLRYAALGQALSTLQEGISELRLVTPDTPIVYRLMRDGVIQRFEYCIDSFWKFLKMYLENVQQVTIDSASPRAILRLALDNKLLTDDECRILLACLADRNLTSHTYNEETAKEIHRHIPRYQGTMKAVVERITID